MSDTDVTQRRSHKKKRKSHTPSDAESSRPLTSPKKLRHSRTAAHSLSEDEAPSPHKGALQRVGVAGDGALDTDSEVLQIAGQVAARDPFTTPEASDTDSGRGMRSRRTPRGGTPALLPALLRGGTPMVGTPARPPAPPRGGTPRTPALRKIAHPKLRYQPPPGEELETILQAAVSQEALTGGDTELWLCQVPRGFDVSELNGKVVMPGSSQDFSVKGPTKKNGERSKEHFSLSLATHDPTELANNNTVDFTIIAPSAETGQLGAVAPPVSGHLVLTRAPPLAEYVIPQVTRQSIPLPAGLKLRHTPFGAGEPLHTPSDKSKKKKKKRRD